MKHINTITLPKQTRRGTYMFNHATIPHRARMKNEWEDGYKQAETEA